MDKADKVIQEIEAIRAGFSNEQLKVLDKKEPEDETPVRVLALFEMLDESDVRYLLTLGKGTNGFPGSIAGMHREYGWAGSNKKDQEKAASRKKLVLLQLARIQKTPGETWVEITDLGKDVLKVCRKEEAEENQARWEAEWWRSRRKLVNCKR